MAAPGCRAEAARDPLALGQGPRRASRERTRRSARARRDCEGALAGAGGGVGARSALLPHAPPSSPGLTGRSSTPRPLDSTTTVSGILDAPLSRGMIVSFVAEGGGRLQLPEQRIAAGHFDLARHRLEVQLLDHAVLDQHRIALGADAETVAGGIELHANRLGEV